MGKRIRLGGIGTVCKVKFLITSIKGKKVRSLNEIERENIVIIALNKILTTYECGSNKSYYHPKALDAVNSWYKKSPIPYERIIDAYRDRDTNELKRMLFGGICSENIELLFDKAILGIRTDGVQLGVVRDSTREIEYTKTMVDTPDITDDTNLELKLRLAGINCIVNSYDCGTIYCIDGDIKQLKLNNCAGLFMKDSTGNITLKNKNFETLYVEAGTLADTQVEIENLVSMKLGVLKGSKLNIHNAFFVNIYKIRDSRVKIENACNILMYDVMYTEIEIANGFNITIGESLINCKVKIENACNILMCDVICSEIEIDNGFNITLEKGLIDSKLKFNCNFICGLLDVSNLNLCHDATFIFNKEVELSALTELIKQLEQVYNTNKFSTKVTFRIGVNRNTYDKIIFLLDEDYMQYIVDMG